MVWRRYYPHHRRQLIRPNEIGYLSTRRPKAHTDVVSGGYAVLAEKVVRVGRKRLTVDDSKPAYAYDETVVVNGSELARV